MALDIRIATPSDLPQVAPLFDADRQSLIAGTALEWASRPGGGINRVGSVRCEWADRH
jgi:hypothetical protein